MKRIWPLLLCCCLLLAACEGQSGGIEEPDRLPDLPEPLPAIEPTPDSTDYAAELSTVFAGVEETPQTDFEYRVHEEKGTAELTAYLGEGEAVRVPDRLGGYPVAGIADSVFANREELKILILPETVTSYGANVLKDTGLTALCAPFPMEDAYLGALWGISESIGNHAPILKSLRCLKILAPGSFCLPANGLSGCTGLVALELPAGSALGDSALANCENLRYLNAETLTNVGEKAFDGCVSLQSLSFGTGLTQIGFAALRNCGALMELRLPFVGTSAQKQTGEPSERTDFLGYLFGASKPALSKGFYPAFLKKITLLEGCVELPDFAFYECTSLIQLSLPTTLTRVGGRALSGCTALTELRLPDGCTEIGDAACAGCTALHTVTMPEGIKVGQNAFLGGLTE